MKFMVRNTQKRRQIIIFLKNLIKLYLIENTNQRINQHLKLV